MQLLPMASSPDGLISARDAVITKTPGWGVLTTTGGGGGGIMRGRMSALQILYENFVRSLFGGFKDLCGYTLGIASAHCFS